jgi:hypothetical protein
MWCNPSEVKEPGPQTLHQQTFEHGDRPDRLVSADGASSSTTLVQSANVRSSVDRDACGRL